MRKFTVIDIDYPDSDDVEMDEDNFDDDCGPWAGEYEGWTTLDVTVKDENDKVYHFISPREPVVVNTKNYHYRAQTHWEPEEESWDEIGIHLSDIEGYIEFEEIIDSEGNRCPELEDSLTEEELEDIEHQIRYQFKNGYEKLKNYR